MSEDELIPYLNNHGFDLVEYPEPERVVVKCIKRGHVKEHYIYYIKNAKCNECSKQDRKEFVKEYIESQGYTLLNEYDGDASILQMLCHNGHYRECRFSGFKKHKCKECTNAIKLTGLINKVSNLGYEFIKYPENARSIAIAYCPKGHIREAKIHNFLNFDCGECHGKNVPKNIEICREVFEGRGFTLLETEYINCKTLMKYICTCGEIRYNTLDTILHSDIDSCYSCKSKKYSGEKHPNWKGGLRSESQLERGRSEYRKWRKSIVERDSYTCQCCNTFGGSLEAHHINNFSDNEEERYSIDNGITMCKNCHGMTVKGSFHHTYGTRNNNIYQLQDYFNKTREVLTLPPIDILEDIIYKDYIFED